MKTLTLNDFGNKFLVDQCRKIGIKHALRDFKKTFKDFLLRSKFNADDIKINFITSKTGRGGERFWFKCPICNKRAGILYSHPITNAIGCRICLNLDYRKHRYKGMAENIQL